MSTLFGKRTKKVLSVALSLSVIVWSLGLFALTFNVAFGATLNEGDIIRGPDGIKVYIINNNGYKRHIFNPEVFNMYGHLKWSNIKAVDQATLDSYTTSDLYRADGDQKVYQTADDGVKRWFNMTGEQFVASGYTFNQVFVVNPKERDFYSTGAEITSSQQQPVAGALNVSVDSSLASATLVADSTASSVEGAQALAPVLKLKFDGSATVTSLKIHRQGISADADVSNMYLYEGDNYLADSPIVSNTYYTFTNSAGLFSVSGSKTITVKMDVAEDTSSGKTLQFGVVASADVASNATSTAGSFPMHGNVMTTATVTDLGKLTLAHISDPGTAMDAGITEQEVWKFSLAAADQKVKVYSIKVTAIGSITASDLTNFKLHDGTSQVGSTVAAMNSDKTVTFALAPYEITSGQTKNISLRADVVAGSSRNFYFQIAGARDIVAQDANYGVYLKLNKADTYTIIKATNTTTINPGTLSITKASDSPSGNVAKDALAVTLAKYNVKASGEAMKVSSLVVRTILSTADDANLDNGKLLLDGVQIGTTKDLDSETSVDSNVTDDDASADDDTTFTFGSSFIVNAGQTRVLTVVADVKKGDGTALTDTNTMTITLEALTGNLIRQSSGTSTDTAEVGANQLTVSAAALTASKNATLANMSVVAGQTGVTIGSWLFTAGAAEAVDVNTIVLKDATGGGETWGDAFNNLKLYSGSTQLGSTITSPTATGDAVTQTFNLSTALRINAGQSIQVDLVADVLTGATWTTDEVAVDSASATGVSTNATVSYAGDSAGQDIAVATAGTLTVATAATPTNPNTSYMVAGDLEQTVAAWKFTADNIEDLKVTRIKLKQAQTDVNAPSNVKNLKLFVGSSQVGSTAPALTDPDSAVSVDEYAIFENSAGLFTVPKNSTVTLVLKTDITPSTNAVFGANGEQFKFRVANITTHTASTDISAKGSLSGAFALGSASANYDGNSQIVVKTKPTFAINSASPTGSLVPGNVEIIRFNITAHTANDVTFDGTNHNILFTIVEAGVDVADSTADLYDASTNTTVATQLTSQDFDDGSVTFTTVNTTIPAGQTKTYYVKANLTDYTATGNSFQMTIGNAAADLSWSDGTTSADINNANVSNIGLPISGNILVKPGA